MSSRQLKTQPELPRISANPNLHMNHVNLIGYMTAEARHVRLEDGKQLMRFTLATKEQFLDARHHAPTQPVALAHRLGPLGQSRRRIRCQRRAPRHRG